ncbi:hypothetical protein N7G274_009640 [Stereocaulon virgatum]|uniref:Uncharacterized protein n=1 Tax=Stereocaulon virgatum TaxID=373712 RepID=A0ABR3ZY61_9LECA
MQHIAGSLLPLLGFCPNLPPALSYIRDTHKGLKTINRGDHPFFQPLHFKTMLSPVTPPKGHDSLSQLMMPAVRFPLRLRCISAVRRASTALLLRLHENREPGEVDSHTGL